MLIGTTLSMPLSQIKLLSNYKSLHAREYLMPMLISEKLELHNELCCCCRNRFARTAWCASTWRARTTPTAVTWHSTLATCQPASPRYSTRGFSVISAVEMVKLTVSYFLQFWRTLAFYGATDIVFCTFGNVCPGIQNQGSPLLVCLFGHNRILRFNSLSATPADLLAASKAIRLFSNLFLNRKEEAMYILFHQLFSNLWRVRVPKKCKKLSANE